MKKYYVLHHRKDPPLVCTLGQLVSDNPPELEEMLDLILHLDLEYYDIVRGCFEDYFTCVDPEGNTIYTLFKSQIFDMLIVAWMNERERAFNA